MTNAQLQRELTEMMPGLTAETAFTIAELVCRRLAEHYEQTEPRAWRTIGGLKKAGEIIALHLSDETFPNSPA